MYAVRASGIVKDFPAGEGLARVLHGIDMDLPFGQLVMLVGPSGCGKTTLISILTGILSASEGEVDVLGQRLSALKDKDKAHFRRKNLGFIFQQYNLLPALSAAENAAVPLVCAGMPLEKAAGKAAEVLASFGMADSVHKLPRQLSGGQQQRVAIARALVHDPPVVVCDEPTAALDAEAGQAVMDILKNKAAGKDRAVIVVSHDNRVFHYADRILRMNDGRIVGDETGRSAAAAPCAEGVAS